MTQHQMLEYNRAYLHNGGYVYTIVHQSNGEDWLNMNWEMLENELPAPEQGPTNNGTNKCGNKFDTGPRKYHRSSLLQTKYHKDTGSEDENIADEVDPPELAPRVDGPAKVLWPEDDETKHTYETSGNTRSELVSRHRRLPFLTPYFM